MTNSTIKSLINRISVALCKANSFKCDDNYNITKMIVILVQKSHILASVLNSHLEKYEYDVIVDEQDYYKDLATLTINFLDPNPKSEFIADRYLPVKYKIEFTYDERFLGYCTCKPEDEGYNALYNCCGHECDWYAPAFEIVMQEDCANEAWEGDESDYWALYDDVNMIISGANSADKRNMMEQEKEALEAQMTSLQERIRLLGELIESDTRS